MSRFQFVVDFVVDNQDTFGVKQLRRVLGINRSSFYKWMAAAPARARKAAEDIVLDERIRKVHQRDRAYSCELSRILGVDVYATTRQAQLDPITGSLIQGGF